MSLPAGPEASESAVEENEDDIQFVSVSSSGVWVFPSQRLCGTSHDVISPRLFTHRPANVWTSHTDWTLWSRAQEWVSDWTPWSRTQERVSVDTVEQGTGVGIRVDTMEQDTGVGIKLDTVEQDTGVGIKLDNVEQGTGVGTRVDTVEQGTGVKGCF